MGVETTLSSRIVSRLVQVDMARTSLVVSSPEYDVVTTREVGDDFGVLGLGVGEHTYLEVLDRLKSGDYELSQLGNAFGAFNVPWMTKDPAAFADFANDWMSLQGRWAAAKAVAQSPSLALPFADTTSAYNGLLRALKQGAPPGSAPIRKGDYDDLYQRFVKAGGHVDLSQMPQPTAPDLGRAILAATAPVDYWSMITGGEKPQGPAADLIHPLADLYAWWRRNEHTIVVLGMIAGGLTALGVLITLVKAAPIVARGVAATYGAPIKAALGVV